MTQAAASDELSTPEPTCRLVPRSLTAPLPGPLRSRTHPDRLVLDGLPGARPELPRAGGVALGPSGLRWCLCSPPGANTPDRPAEPSITARHPNDWWGDGPFRLCPGDQPTAVRAVTATLWAGRTPPPAWAGNPRPIANHRNNAGLLPTRRLDAWGSPSTAPQHSPAPPGQVAPSGACALLRTAPKPHRRASPAPSG